VASELGQRYLAAMELAGRYAYAGREWVVERVRAIIGGGVTDSVHNHHNYAWRERHGERDLWVVRKGATPAFPGQRGFVGGSIGDDAVMIEGVDSPEAKPSLYSTIHGAGRLFGRKEAKRRFTRAEMDAWLQSRGVTLVGADLDEIPMACGAGYRKVARSMSGDRNGAITRGLSCCAHPVLLLRCKHEVEPNSPFFASRRPLDRGPVNPPETQARRLSPATSHDTIEVPNSPGVLKHHAASEICLGRSRGRTIARAPPKGSQGYGRRHLA